MNGTRISIRKRIFVLTVALAMTVGGWTQAEGLTNGHAKITLPDSGVYEGEIKDGLFNGKGTIVYPNGARFEGEFKDGLEEGWGTVIMPDGERVTSQYLHGERLGHSAHTRPTHGFEFLLVALLIISLIANVALLMEKRSRDRFQPQMARNLRPEQAARMGSTEAFEKIAVLDSEVQAEALDALLAERGIPHQMRSYRDSAYDGIFQTSHGWGHVEAAKDHGAAVLQALKDLAGPPDEAKGGQGNLP